MREKMLEQLKEKEKEQGQEAQKFGVNERTIQRDIDDIRNFMESDIGNTGIVNSVIYDHVNKGVRMEQIYKLKLTNGEILAICKILLDSRAFPKSEMSDVLSKLISCCVPEHNQKLVTELIRNEELLSVHTNGILKDERQSCGKAESKTCRNYVFRVLFLSDGIY